MGVACLNASHRHQLHFVSSPQEFCQSRCRKKKGLTRTALRLMPYAAVTLLILLSIIAGVSMRRSSAKSMLLASTEAQLQTHTTELASIRVGAPASHALKTSKVQTQPKRR